MNARTALKYGAGLIGLYLIVRWASGFDRSFTAVGKTGVGVIKAFQGR